MGIILNDVKIKYMGMSRLFFNFLEAKHQNWEVQSVEGCPIRIAITEKRGIASETALNIEVGLGELTLNKNRYYLQVTTYSLALDRNQWREII